MTFNAKEACIDLTEFMRESTTMDYFVIMNYLEYTYLFYPYSLLILNQFVGNVEMLNSAKSEVISICNKYAPQFNIESITELYHSKLKERYLKERKEKEGAMEIDGVIE